MRAAMEMDIVKQFLSEVRAVRDFPYAWPGDFGAQAILRTGYGTCASKHALLAERLAALQIDSSPLLITGPLIPPLLATQPALRNAMDLIEVHECLTVLTPWAGPVRVDITWDPALIAKGLPGDMHWSGNTDMPLAVPATAPGWSVPREVLRPAKEALRNRLYTTPQRSSRDAALRVLSKIFAGWRE